MKTLKINFLLLVAVLFFAACSSDDDHSGNSQMDETENLQLVTTFNADNHSLDLFTASGKLRVGYNQVFLRFEDENGNYLSNTDLNWDPMMTMQMNGMEHHHGTPHGEIAKASGKETLYEAYIVFMMASDEPNHFWELNLNYNYQGQTYEMNDKVTVISTETNYNKVYTSVMGSDDVNYLLALVEPSKPEMGVNDMVVALFKADDGGHHFHVVDNYSLQIDSRMPGMGNHSAPGNEELTQGEDGFYHGKVGLSMTGYWKLNLLLQNEDGETLAGEPVTEDNLESSLHFKIEF